VQYPSATPNNAMLSAAPNDAMLSAAPVLD
jgi:hypothetical protein